MQKSLRLLLIAVVVLGASSLAFAGQYSTAWPQYLADQNDGQQMVTGIITMADQVDLRSLQDRLYAQGADRRAWHEAVVLALQDKATLTQADIMARLEELAASGQVEKYQSLWIANLVAIKAVPAVFDELVSRPDVAQVSPDYAIESVEPVSEGGDEPIVAGHEIGLERIHADDVWAMGYTGEGRLVSHLDTGVDGDHPAYAARWKGVSDPRYASNPEWAWFDPLTNTQFPFDSGSHGTHTMGTITGLGVATGDTVGVAFGAEWISAGVIDRGGLDQTILNAFLAFQWIADPDLNPGTVWDVPDVCSNSWGVTTGHGVPPCDEYYWVVLDGCEAAGVIVCFAAGNEGPGPYSLRRPADRATTALTSFSVGAVEGDNPNLPIAGFSSRGPSNCTPDGLDTFKPEVSAPGVNVRSSVPGGGYQGGWSGTSMACPHVAGVVALVRQANPNLTSEQVRQILLDTAVDYGDVGEDNDYGMGVVNAQAAVTLALAYLDGWGTLGGVITDQASGNPLPGARLTVVNRPWGATARPITGQYYMFMPADTAWVIRIENNPSHLPMYDTVTVIENDTILQNYALEGKVTVTLKASFGNPVDAGYRSFFMKGSWNVDGFWDPSWTAPQIEVKDDGVAPDQTAGDGIFTGNVMLARDLSHTYNWALYSESYGGEAARLQNGASFQILTLVPPTVPTLSVNPSGSDHNWNVSVYGNGGALQLELLRGVNGRPTKWGAAIQLTQGISYLFRFRVMHSTMASYGVGGVGGADILFDCTFTGSYDFIFDDRTDSYVVQLAGTEGPPTFLSPRGGFDGHIPVGWLPPGTTESSEMSYDDGTLVNGYYYFAYDWLMATMFTPQTWPVTIDSLIVHVLTEGDQYWPWPDGAHDPVGVAIFLDDGTGFPQADPAFYTEVTCNLGEWIRVDVEEVLVPDGNFWIAMNNLAGGGEDGMGLDAFTDFPGNKWAREGGVWGQQDIYTGDHMIRAKVFGGAAGFWMGYDSSPAEEISADVPVIGDPSMTSGLRSANAVPSAANARNLDRMAYHPRVSRVHPPMTSDTEVLAGYRLYRGTVTGPYNDPVPNMVNNPAMPGGLIQTTNYDDWAHWNGTDSIQNGVLYYYQASAVYDIGAGQYVEVGPSNEGSATAVNHAPANPVGLVGGSVGNIISLTWNRNTDYDIYQYKVFERLYNQQNFTLIATLNHPDTDYSFTQPIEGIHRYKVAATDDGSPNLQSPGFSNSVDIPIGAIPPRGMRATTDEEFQISLRWSHPGGGSGGDLSVMVVASDEASMFMNELAGFDDVTEAVYYDARNGTPTLEELMNHTVAVVWSNYPFTDPTAMGNVLADFVDAGGGVVLVQFSFGSGWNLQGRIMDEYASFSPGPTMYNNVDLGDYDPSHPIMEGVTSVTEFFAASVSLNNGGEQVAAFTNGTPFVAVNPELPVACVNGFIGDPRLFQGDMILVVHNAMSWTAGGAEVIPQSYNIWKASSQGGLYSLLHSQPGTDPTRYVDAPVPNAVPYWYYVTAVYAGPDESDPSDTAQGIAMNYPPSAPFDLTGIADARAVNLAWSFTDIMGDWDHFNVYKKLIPGGTFALEGSTTNYAFVDTIPPGEDGVWAYVVKAVDDGAPQLESNNSNQVFVPVGNLPPNNLVATSGHEFVVPLHWSIPGMRPTTTVSYDDGTLVNAYYYYDYTWLMANQFVTSGGAEVETLWVHVLTEGDDYWPWPDGNPDPVGISVFDDDGTGYPQTDPAFYIEVTGEVGQWISVPIEGGLQLNGPSFWVALNNLAGGGEEGMGIDAFTDYPQYKWAREGGNWSPLDLYSGDHMIRATIIDNGRLLTLGENAPTTELALRNQRFTTEPGMVAVTSGARPGTPAVIANLRSPQYDIQRPFDTELLVGYNIYRALTAGFPINPGNLLRGYLLQGLATAYDDSAVVNGTTYFYKVTAIYDNNSVIEESPISNEAVGTPQNNPPLAPYNLAGSVNDHTVNLTYAFFDSVGDWNHFNIYKQQMPGGTRLFVGSTTNLNYSFNIPAGEDGVYRFEVTAVDDGAPPIEGPPSEDIFLPVGHLPPGALTATSNMDSKIPLRWMLPGSWRALSIGSDAVRPQQPSIPAPLDMSLKNSAEPHNPPMLLGRGGPDAFGYEWVDSDEPDGPNYQWRDITGIGEQLPMSFDDENIGPYEIGFDFEFYGQVFTQFYVCSNGWISFTSLSGQYFNYPLPDINSPENFVAPWWDDLYPPSGGEYWYYSDGNELVVSFIGVPHITGQGTYTFQIVLRGSGSVIYNYDTMVGLVTEATIGIQNSDRTIGLQVVYNAPYIHDQMAIRLASSPEGFAPVHYRLYRSTTQGFPIGPSYLINSNIAGGEAAFTDSGTVVNGTTYYYRLTAVWPDSIASPPSNEASGRAVMGARLAVNPTTISQTVGVGQMDTSILQIINNGGLALDYSITATIDQRAFLAGMKPVKKNAVSGDMPFSRVEQPKGTGSSNPDNPPMLLGRGGPDAFGYQWIDSDEPGGPTYQWADIIGRGTDLFMSDDENQGPFDLGFDFSYYGNLYNTINICSNGWVSFTSFDITYSNGPLPDPFAPSNLVAPFWDDMNPLDGGQISFFSNADSAVISWIDIPHFGGGGPYTYQVIILRSGLISFNYDVINFPETEQTIGIQNVDGSIGLQVAYDQSYVHSGLSVLFTTGWLNTDPRSGNVGGGSTGNVMVIYDATMLTAGTYTGQLVVSGSDINHYVGQVTVPVTLTVVGGEGCDYVIGDINDNDIFNGLDVTYMVRYLKGGPPPPYSCECPVGNTWFVAGDVNGSCTFNGIDVTRAVLYFKGGPLPIPCATCPPGLLGAPQDGDTPAIMPILKSNSQTGSSSQE